jgi:translation initiation factor IF-2
LADFKAHYQGPANGVVIDSYLHPQLKTVVNELLIQGGCLQEKDNIFCQGRLGKVKTIYNISEKKVAEVFPGDLAKVIG